MRELIFLPTQGPHLPRSDAEPASHDWQVQCKLAAERWHAQPDSTTLYVPSAFHQRGSRSELEWYGEALSALGVSAEHVHLHHAGFDTVEQCKLAIARSIELEARLIVIACAVQAPRLPYLLRLHPHELIIAHGVPVTALVRSQRLLAHLDPWIDRLGLRPLWQRYIHWRRSAGQQ